MICKNCGKDVIPKMSPAQILIGVVLVATFFVIFGILYFVFCNKKTCPKCGRNVYRKEGELISSESASVSKVVAKIYINNDINIDSESTSYSKVVKDFKPEKSSKASKISKSGEEK